MSVEDEKFQSSNECWILNKLFKNEDKKVRDHDHISGKYRGSGHSDCSINIDDDCRVLTYYVIVITSEMTK